MRLHLPERPPAHRPRGRPRKSNSRTRTLTVRLSERQLADFERACELEGAPVRSRMAAVVLVRWSLVALGKAPR